MDRRDNNPRNSSGGYRRPPRRDQRQTNREEYPAAARLPEIYYRRRRVAAVVAILLVVIVVVAVLARMSRNSINTPVATDAAIATSTTEKPAPTSTEKATTISETTAGSQTDSKAEEVSETASKSSEPSESVTAKGSCELADLQIEASADHPNYNAGDLPSFFMTVRNPTDADCEIDLTQQVLRFEVYTLDTNQRVWADIDCNDPVGTGTKVFKAGEEKYYKTQWSRLYSDPQTCTGRAEVAPGGYYLHTVIGDNASAPFTFNLGG